MPEPDNFSPAAYYRSEGEPIPKEVFTIPPLPPPPPTDSESALEPVVKTLFSRETTVMVVPEVEVTIVEKKELVLAG